MPVGKGRNKEQPLLQNDALIASGSNLCVIPRIYPLLYQHWLHSPDPEWVQCVCACPCRCCPLYVDLGSPYNDRLPAFSPLFILFLLQITTPFFLFFFLLFFFPFRFYPFLKKNKNKNLQSGSDHAISKK